MRVDYSHPTYELNGSWNRYTGDMALHFLVTRASVPGINRPDKAERIGTLTERITKRGLKPYVTFEPIELPDASFDAPDIPEDEICPNQPIDGIVHISSSFMRALGYQAMEKVAEVAASVYGDVMLPRAESA